MWSKQAGSQPGTGKAGRPALGTAGRQAIDKAGWQAGITKAGRQQFKQALIKQAGSQAPGKADRTGTG